MIDHFSKFILSWHVSTKVSSKIKKQTVEDAYKKYCIHNPKIIYSDISSMLNKDIKTQYYINGLISGHR